jgi:hypothetical protein
MPFNLKNTWLNDDEEDNNYGYYPQYNHGKDEGEIKLEHEDTC